MRVNIKKMVLALFLIGGAAAVNASVCTVAPGSVSCGHGRVDNISGNGMVTVNGTVVLGATLVNGIFKAEDAHFFSLEVNGNVTLAHCTINNEARIKGSLTASATTFAKTLEVYSSEIRFIKSKVNGDLHFGHINAKKQIVHLDNSSEVAGDVIFDDGEGEVILRGQSKIGGKVIGGHALLK